MNNVSKKTKILLSFMVIPFIWFGISVSFTFAQLDIGLRSADITVTLSPEIPEPNKDVTITVTSYSVDLNKTALIWKQDGKMIQTGVGRKTATIRAGAIGTTSIIDIEIFSGETSIKKSVLLQPADMDILWESTDSYTPPFYKGKALPGSESQIKLVAVPAGGKTNLVYNWKRNFVSAPGASGFGKNAMTIGMSYLNQSEIIEVTATAATGSYTAANQISLKSISPQVIYYENHPDLGLLLNSVITNGARTSRSSFEIVAEPFFFSTKKAGGAGLSYAWTVGGNTIPNTAGNRITVQFPDDVQGGTAVTTAIESKTKLFQDARSLVSIIKQ